MAEKDFRMPDLGEGLTESELVSWQVAEGDRIELNQVIAEVETAKALVQVPSPFAGTVTRLHVEPGATVQVGAPILTVDVVGDDDAPAGTVASTAGRGEEAPPAPSEATAQQPEPDVAAARPTPDEAGRPVERPAAERTSVLVGYGPRTAAGERPRRRPRSAAWLREHATGEPAARPAAPAGRTGERPRSYPPVRKLAHDLGVDLTALVGTGPEGLITREDVLAWKDRGGTSARTNGRHDEAREERIPVTGVRKHTAAAMVASAFTAPHATEFLTVDVTGTTELVARLREDRRFAGTRVTVLTLVAKAVLVALRRHPALNARWDEAAGEIVRYRYVNLGIAAATPRGLMVPNVKDADRLDLRELAGALAELTEAARGGTTPPAALSGGTISITNIGVFGVDAGTPILNPGEAAILATGAVRRMPWEHDGGIALRDVMTLSLSFDHRLVDGAEASGFLADVGRVLVAPGATLTLV